jgi:serine/threonine protein kinase
MPNQQEGRRGQQIGEYRLVRKLGGGSFGIVYLVEQVHEHNTQAALKLLHISLTKGEDFKAFLNEASMIRLRHPHIVPLLNFGISREDLPFLVMEYAPQGTLRDHHPKGERISLSSIVSYVDQIAPALQYAHDQRVIHRDIKPENILVRTDGTLMVSDFGLAKILEQSVLISQQKVAGTPVYMAPEQYRGYPCFASDQYALAVMIYEWICGVQPFCGTEIGLAVQHMNTPPPKLRDHLPQLSEAVEHVVLKALAKLPEDRFERIEEMASALREAMQPLIVPSPPVEAMNTAPLILPEPISQLEPVIQTADIPLSHQRSRPALHSTPQDPPRTKAHPLLHKRRSGVRSSLLIGGVLGLISLLIVLIIVFKPMIFPPLITPPHTSSSTPVPPGMVGWWTFDTNTITGATVLDQSGQRNNGNMLRGPLQTSGTCNQAMAFSGTSWIQIPPIPGSTSTVITSSFTIEAWVKIHTIGKKKTILWKADTRPNVDPYFMDIDGTEAAVGFDDNNNIRYQARAEVGDSIGKDFFHLAGVFDANKKTLAIYVNGTLQDQRSGVTQKPLTDQSGMTVYIGGMDHSNQNMHGILDEVRLYSRALTLKEINADMQQCLNHG